MARAPKLYRITKTKSSRFGGDVRTYTQEGTLEALIKAYSYTIECRSVPAEISKGNFSYSKLYGMILLLKLLFSSDDTTKGKIQLLRI